MNTKRSLNFRRARYYDVVYYFRTTDGLTGRDLKHSFASAVRQTVLTQRGVGGGGGGCSTRSGVVSGGTAVILAAR